MAYSRYTLPGTRKPRKQKHLQYTLIKYSLPKNLTYKWIADNLHKINLFKKEITKKKLWFEVQAVAFYEKLKQEQTPKNQTPLAAFIETKLSVQLFTFINKYRFKISIALLLLWMSFITEITLSQVSNKIFFINAISNKTREISNSENKFGYSLTEEAADALGPETYRFKGRLVNKKGIGLANVDVKLYDKDADVKTIGTRTNNDGIFAFEGYITGVEQIIDNIPKEFSVSNVYPNPTAGKFSSDLNLPSSGNVDIKVFDLNGEKVLDLFSGFLEAGKYKISGDLSNSASAAYFMNVNFSGKENETEKIMKIEGYPLNGGNAAGVNLSRINNDSDDYQKRLLKTNNDRMVDSIVFLVDARSKVKLTNIPLGRTLPFPPETVDLGTIVGNQSTEIISNIPNVDLKEGEQKQIDLSKYFKDADSELKFTSTVGKINGNWLTLLVDSTVFSGIVKVRAADVDDDRAFAEQTFKFTARHKPKLIVGPVYDLWTKYDKKSSAGNLIPGRKKPVNARVFLGSDPTKFADVDSLTGLAVIQLDYQNAGKDSIIIIPKDTSFVKYKNNRIYISDEKLNEIKAFNDGTGIPLFKAGKEVLDYFAKMSGIAYFNNPEYGDYVQTSPRIRNQDIPIKINMNRKKDPAGGMQADSLMVGHHQLIKKINEKIGFNFLEITEVGENQGAITSVAYDAESDAYIFDYDVVFEGKYWYVKKMDYKIRGPPQNTMMEEKYLSFIGAHEFARVLGFFFRNNTDRKDIGDIMYVDILSRYDKGYRTYGTDREFMAMAINFLLEMNPKWLDYSK
ncbi:MAG: T9SS type A sorting domain-containing protein [Melioribacteraceae bacterium]|nr:T9SS type A sorting domain-containing protein [Melioribacteraceae bacterium]